MKKFLLIIFLASFFVIQPQNVEAHLDETDGTITGTLHNDELFVGKETMLDFIIDDSANAFKTNTCTCTVTISQKGKLPYTQNFTNATYDSFSTQIAHIRYNFPQAGTYHVTLTGKPIAPNTFQPFTLHWEVSATKQAAKEHSEKSTSQTHHQESSVSVLPIFAGAMVTVAVLLFAFHKKITRIFLTKLQKEKSN